MKCCVAPRSCINARRAQLRAGAEGCGSAYSTEMAFVVQDFKAPASSATAIVVYDYLLDQSLQRLEIPASLDALSCELSL
eukprot:scaffold1290_cov367-Prasinococcus_capsulatus_cf.AAC.2